MSRIRTVKPEFFQSDTISGLSFRARLTFIGLWTYADDEGRCKDHPRLICAALYPLEDDVTAADVDDDLAELEAAGLVIRYDVDGDRYLAVRSFAEHQKINRPTPSRIPDPPSGPSPQPPERERSSTPHGGLSESSPPERKGKEMERALTDEDECSARVLPIGTSRPADAGRVNDEFSSFWEHYPRKVSKKDAQKAWKGLRVPDRRAALAAVEAYARSQRGRDPQFIPYPATWLRGAEWEDVGKPGTGTHMPTGTDVGGVIVDTAGLWR